MLYSTLKYYPVERFYINVYIYIKKFFHRCCNFVSFQRVQCVLVHPLIVVVSQPTMTVCVPIVYVWIFVGKPSGSHPSCAQEARKKLKKQTVFFFVNVVENNMSACKSV